MENTKPQVITDLQLVDNSINRLSSIQVPVAYTVEIGVPLYNTLTDLHRLRAFIVENAKLHMANAEPTGGEDMAPAIHEVEMVEEEAEETIEEEVESNEV